MATLTEKDMVARITLLWNGANGELSTFEYVSAVAVVDEDGKVRHRTESSGPIDIKEVAPGVVEALVAEAQRVHGVMAQKQAAAELEQAERDAANAKAALERAEARRARFPTA